MLKYQIWAKYSRVLNRIHNEHVQNFGYNLQKNIRYFVLFYLLIYFFVLFGFFVVVVVLIIFLRKIMIGKIGNAN